MMLATARLVWRMGRPTHKHARTCAYITGRSYRHGSTENHRRFEKIYAPHTRTRAQTKCTGSVQWMGGTRAHVDKGSAIMLHVRHGNRPCSCYFATNTKTTITILIRHGLRPEFCDLFAASEAFVVCSSTQIWLSTAPLCSGSIRSARRRPALCRVCVQQCPWTLALMRSGGVSSRPK